MFDFSVIPLEFRMGAQNRTSNFYNLGNWTPILNWHTSMSLWFNYLEFYI